MFDKDEFEVQVNNRKSKMLESVSASGENPFAMMIEEEVEMKSANK